MIFYLFISLSILQNIVQIISLSYRQINCTKCLTLISPKHCTKCLSIISSNTLYKLSLSHIFQNIVQTVLLSYPQIRCNKLSSTNILQNIIQTMTLSYPQIRCRNCLTLNKFKILCKLSHPRIPKHIRKLSKSFIIGKQRKLEMLIEKLFICKAYRHWSMMKFLLRWGTYEDGEH